MRVCLPAILFVLLALPASAQTVTHPLTCLRFLAVGDFGLGLLQFFNLLSEPDPSLGHYEPVRPSIRFGRPF